MWLGDKAEVAISDTVGFIRELPHSLVDAFRATLEETAQADLLLHVVDSANALREEQAEAVNAVLEEIGAGDVPQIVVMNQIDRSGLEPEVVRDAYGKILNIKVSAATGAGVDLLRGVLADAAREGGGRLAPAA
jgi:GTP-binding protein HflX